MRGEHVPQPLLKSLFFDGLLHLIRADHQMGLDGLVQSSSLKLFASDASQHHTMPPRKRELAGV